MREIPEFAFIQNKKAVVINSFHFDGVRRKNGFYIPSFDIEDTEAKFMIFRRTDRVFPDDSMQNASEQHYKNFMLQKLKDKLKEFNLSLSDISKSVISQLISPDCMNFSTILTPAKILHFHLDKKWFQAIQCRTKYYEIRPLMGGDGKEIINQYSPDYDYIRFYLGYPKKGDEEKIITREFKGYQVCSAQDRRFWRLLTPNEAEFLEKQYGFVNPLSGEPRDFIFLKADGENIDD